MKFRSSNVGAAAMVVACALAGCAGSVADTPDAGGTQCMPGALTTTDAGIAANFDTVKAVLQGGGAIQGCASAPCHAVGGMAPPAPEKPLTLQNNADLYTNMTSYVAVQCDNMKLIEPGHPEKSALIKILSGPCGVAPRMPYQCTTDACIPDDYIAALSLWITNCAPGP